LDEVTALLGRPPDDPGVVNAAVCNGPSWRAVARTERTGVKELAHWLEGPDLLEVGLLRGRVTWKRLLTSATESEGGSGRFRGLFGR
jgi:hypothetical protein